MKSQEQLQQALNSLTDGELRKLKRFAKSRTFKLKLRSLGHNEEDLIQEALIATIEGRRVWPEDIDLFTHLAGAIRSISSSWSGKKGEYLESDITKPGEQSPLDQLATTLNPERILIAKELLQQVVKMFEADEEALQVIELLGAKYTAKEIQKKLLMSPKKVGAIIKRIRRRVSKLMESDTGQAVVNTVSQSKVRAKQSTRL